MSEQKRYTAQKIREVADMFNSATNPIAVCSYDKGVWSPNYIECHVERMLRQAADAEEENAKLREENAKLTNIITTECNKCGDCAKFGNDCTAGDVDGNEDCRACDKFVPKEVAQLKARLEAVVKIMKQREQWFSCRTCSQDILRAARGE